MKKIIFLGFIASSLMMVSCKKDRICSCVFTSSDSPGISQNAEYTILETSKGTANKACVSTKEEETENGTIITTTSTCKLK